MSSSEPSPGPTAGETSPRAAATVVGAAAVVGAGQRAATSREGGGEGGGGTAQARQPEDPDRYRRRARRRRRARAALARHGGRRVERAAHRASRRAVGRPHARERRSSTCARTGCSRTIAAPIESIWPEVRDTLTPALRERRQLYADDLPGALARRRARPVPGVDRVGARVRQARLGRVPVPVVLHARTRVRSTTSSGCAVAAVTSRSRSSSVTATGSRASSATRRWSSCREHQLVVRVRRRALGVRQLAAAAVGRDHRHRVRAVPRSQHAARGSAGPTPATTASRTTTRTSTSSPGGRGSRSSPARRGRCTSPSPAGRPTPRSATRACSCAC